MSQPNQIQLVDFYLSQGYSLIPLRFDEETKKNKPGIKWEDREGSNGVKATRQEILEWLAKPWCVGLAVICGSPSGGLVVIDFDDLKLTPVEKLLSQTEIQDNFQVKTAKGVHVHFRCNQQVDRHILADKVGVDILGDGGYAVLPPSIHHKSKEPYTVLNGLKSPGLWHGDMEEELFGRLEVLHKKWKAPRKQVNIDELLCGVTEPGRNKIGIIVISFLRRQGLSEERSWQEFVKWNQKNKPPLVEKELKDVFDSGWSYEQPLRYWFSRDPKKRLPYPEIGSPLDYGTHEELWEEVRKFVEAHWEYLDKRCYHTITATIFASWMIEQLDIVTYSFFYGLKNSGKTRGLRVLGLLGRRGVLGNSFSGPSIPTAIQELDKPFLLFDEAEKYIGQDKVELIGILNGGQTREDFYARCTFDPETKKRILELLDCFCFKAVSSVIPMPDTTESRGIIYSCRKTRRKVQNIRSKASKDWAYPLRRKLLKWSQDFKVPDPLPTLEAYNYYARESEIFEPILSVAPADPRKIILEFALEYLEKIEGEEAASKEADLVLAVVEARKVTKGDFIASSLVAKAYNEGKPNNEQISAEKAGKQLRQIGFIQKRSSKANGVLWNEELVKALLSNFKFYSEEGVSPSGTSTTSTSMEKHGGGSSGGVEGEPPQDWLGEDKK